MSLTYEFIVRSILVAVTTGTIAMGVWLIANYILEILPMRRQLNLFAPNDTEALMLHSSITTVALAVAINSAYSLAQGFPASPLLFLVPVAFTYQSYAVFRFLRGYRHKLAVELARLELLRQSPNDRLTRESQMTEGT